MDITFKLRWCQDDDHCYSASSDDVTSYYLTCGNIVLGGIDIINITKNFFVCGGTSFDVEWFDAFYRGGAKEHAAAMKDKTLAHILSHIEKQAKLYLERLCNSGEQPVNVIYSVSCVNPVTLDESDV